MMSRRSFACFVVTALAVATLLVAADPASAQRFGRRFSGGYTPGEGFTYGYGQPYNYGQPYSGTFGPGQYSSGWQNYPGGYYSGWGNTPGYRWSGSQYSWNNPSYYEGGTGDYYSGAQGNYYPGMQGGVWSGTGFGAGTDSY